VLHLPQSTTPIATVTLSADSPTAKIDASTIGPLSTVTLAVRERSNPGVQAFRIEASIAPGAGAPILLGSVSPYPPGRPENFVLPVPSGAAVAPESRAMLQLRLLPVSADRPLAEPLQVDVEVTVARR
jgi:hypothetical protein